MAIGRTGASAGCICSGMRADIGDFLVTIQDLPDAHQMTVPPKAHGFMVSLIGAAPGACVEVGNRPIKGTGMHFYRDTTPFIIQFGDLGGVGDNWFVNLVTPGDDIIIPNPQWVPQGPMVPFFTFPSPIRDVTAHIQYFFH